MKDLALTAIIVATLISAPAARSDVIQTDQTGYYKSGNNERIIAYHSPEKLTQEQAQQIADDQIFTPGRIGRIAFYSGEGNPAPEDALTLSSGLQPALILISNPPYDTWDWLFMQHPSGAAELRER